MSSPFDQLTSKDSAAPNRFHDNKYGDADRREIVKALEQGARRTIARAAFYAAIHRIEDVAAEYLALKIAAQPFPARGKRRRRTAPTERCKFPARSEQRKQLNRLALAKPSLFKKAALALHPALWPSIALRASELPHDQQIALFGSLKGPHGMDIETMTTYRKAIQAAAAQAHGDFEVLSSKPGPKGHVLLAHFAWRLVPIYEETTGKAPTAYYSENYHNQFKGRNTPFIRFVAMCLEPIDSGSITPELGEIIYSFVFRDRKSD